MSSTPDRIVTRRRRRAAASTLAAVVLAMAPTPGTASANEPTERSGTVTVLVLPATDVVAPAPPTDAAMMPGPQSCGTSECVGDFVDACAAAGGVATETKVILGPPDGLEVECVQNASMPR